MATVQQSPQLLGVGGEGVLLSIAQLCSSFCLAKRRPWADFPSPRAPSSIANYSSVAWQTDRGSQVGGNGILEVFFVNLDTLQFAL